MKKAGLLLVVLIVASTVFGQGVPMFDKKKQDIGDVNEADSTATFLFSFRNAGRSALKVTDVVTPCGCTKPSWSKEAIQPGQESEIVVTYKTWNRPGPFDKEIVVKTNGSPSTIKLKISGMVLPKPKKAEFDYPEQIGALRFKAKDLQVGNITTEKVVEKIFTYYNSADTSISLNNELITPAHIQVNFYPATIPAKSEGNIVLRYDPVAKNDYGYCTDTISFTSSDTALPKEFLVHTSIKEYFPVTTGDSLPELKVDKGAIDFGEARIGDTDSLHFSLTNSGKKALMIRKVEYLGQFFEVKLNKKTIQPGETVNMIVQLSIDKIGYAGKKSEGVTLYVNDPQRPRRTLKVIARLVR